MAEALVPDNPENPENPENPVEKEPEGPMDYVMIRLPRMQRVDYLAKGELIANRFEVDRKLGQGGFGQVFEAYDHVQKKSVAIKLFVGRNCYRSEVYFLKTFAELSATPSLISSGPHRTFHYLTMDLVGPNLDALGAIFHGLSKRTIIFLSLNIIDAMIEIHEAGFIHGDIKPANIAIGMPPDGMRNVFIFDFSLTRKIVVGGNVPGLFGTLVYAGIPRHRGQPVTVLDDYYSFLYTVLDLKSTLPWAHILDRNEVFAGKTRYTDHLCNRLHPHYLKFKKYLDNCRNYLPNYRMLKSYVVTAMQAEKLDFTEPFEWEMFPDRVWTKTPKRDRPMPSGIKKEEPVEPLVEPPVVPEVEQKEPEPEIELRPRPATV